MIITIMMIIVMIINVFKDDDRHNYDDDHYNYDDDHHNHDDDHYNYEDDHHNHDDDQCLLRSAPQALIRR